MVIAKRRSRKIERAWSPIRPLRVSCTSRPPPPSASGANQPITATATPTRAAGGPDGQRGPGSNTRGPARRALEQPQAAEEGAVEDDAEEAGRHAQDQEQGEAGERRHRRAGDVEH